MNRTGPITGMSARIGILMVCSRRGWLRCGEFFNNVENMNEVAPNASIFRTTPTTMWSALYLMVNRPNSAPMAAPPIGAPISPNQGLENIEPMTAPKKAPNRS